MAFGSTSVLTDGNGNAEEDLVYYPYGETFTNTGTADVAYKYTGKERDGSTGLYFYEARYYDAALGRFISADTIVPNPGNPQDFNRYTYANNNPVIFTDPTGHFACGGICVGIIVGAVVGGVSAGIQSDWDAKATITGAVIGGIAGGVGVGVGGAVSTAVGSQYGAIAGSAAGGLLGGAAAGGTSAIFYRAAGYNTNIGLAIATGAAGGLIAGGFYGIGNYYGEGLGGFAGSIASAPASGAVSAAITGNDPGAGAVLALRDFGLRMGVSAIIIAANFRFNQSLIQNDFVDDGRREVSSPSLGRPITTHRDVIGALQPGRYRGSSNISGNIDVALVISNATTLGDGFTLLGAAYKKGAFDAQIARLLGTQQMTPGMRFALQFSRVPNGVGAAVLASGGGYMIGSVIISNYPNAGNFASPIYGTVNYFLQQRGNE